MKLQRYPITAFRLLALLGFLMSFGFAQAQDEEVAKAKVSGGFGYFTPGGVSLGTTELDNYLETAGAGAYGSQKLTLGGGGMAIARNFVLGGEGHSLLKKNVNSASLDVNISGGWGMGYLGYVLLGKKGVLLYPKVGVGGYNHRMIVKNSAGGHSVDDVFGGTYSGTEMIKKGLLLSGSVSFDFMPGFDETAGSGLVFGLEAGYNYAATEKAWDAYGTALANGPGQNMTGAYVRLHIGFGGWHRQ